MGLMAGAMGDGRLLNRALLTLMAGHFVVDLLSGLLPVTYPLLRERFRLDLVAVGAIATTFTGAASLSQPFFGLLADRYGSRQLASVAVAWMALFVALLGFAPTYGLTLAVAALAGLGSGAYHPQGAANAAGVVSDRQVNTAMSLYTIGGTSGFALGPLLGAALFGLLGPRGLAATLPLGLGVALWLAVNLRGIDHRRRPPPGPTLRYAQEGSPPARPPALPLALPGSAPPAPAGAGRAPIRWRPLLATVGIVMLKSWVFLVLLTFTPILYRGLGYDARFYSPLLFTIIICGSLGTFCGGVLGDRVGRRPVIVGSLVLLGPAVWLYLAFPGPGAFALGGLLGFVSEASSPVTLTLAQRLLPGRVGMASGLILGLGFATGGIGASLTGALGDRIGLAPALAALPALLPLALLLTLALPREERAAPPAPVHTAPPAPETAALAAGAGGEAER